MSDDTLSQLIADAIAAHLAPVVKWLYAVFAGVIVGTAFVVGMVYDVKYSIVDAKRDADEAKATALSAIQLTTDLRAVVVGHDREIAVLKIQNARGGVKP